MITVAQITAEDLTAISEIQQRALMGLIEQYQPYADAPGRWPSLEDKIGAEMATPTVKTRALKAVLTALGRLPAIVVESQGQVSSPSMFATKENWDTLAFDALNILYGKSIILGPQTIGVIKRSTESMTQKDRTVFKESETGRRY